MIKMFNDHINRDDYTDHFLIGNLLTSFAHLMRNYGNDVESYSSRSSNLPNDFLVMSYIQDNLANITLTDVAKHFNFSISHCSRLIK